MSKIRIGLIGAGQRGKDVYGRYALEHQDDLEFVAVAEPDEIKRKEFSSQHHIPQGFQFSTSEELLEKDKFCDALIIATPDRLHFIPAKLALGKGYHVLLEKPMSNDPGEVMELGRLAGGRKNVFMICHVLRYTSFFQTIKGMIDNDEIGELISIQHNENVGYYHFAHSFVRGNWRNSDSSSPLILQKSCHDMDILLWLVGKDCTKVASFGELSYFNREHRPENAGDRCVQCAAEKECPYSAMKIYYNSVGAWPTSAITEDQTMEGVRKAVYEGPYGRCVYGCDNNVMDHQSTILKFENGVAAAFNLTAFTNKINRTIKIMGTKGEIRAADSSGEIELQIFGEEYKKTICPKASAGGHGGGDTGLMEDFVSLLSCSGGKALTSAEASVQSHMMAFAAEESRLHGTVIDMKEYYRKRRK